MRAVIAFLLITLPLPAAAAVRISEVAWMGVAGESGQYGEWIELHNDGPDPVNLAGWTLMVDGGSTVLFSLESSVPPGGYLLVERTTASMPDPVPGVDGVQGPFGGGGLSNIGEDLALHDGEGIAVHSLPYAAGWPAGDAASKESMQWGGSGWQTAAPTPGAPYGGTPQEPAAEPEATQDTPPNSVIRKAEQRTAVKQTPHIALTIPKILAQHVPYKFRADVYTAAGHNPAGGSVYRWNFGDGTMVETMREPAAVLHTYQHPGTYTLWFGYYESIFAEDPAMHLETTVAVREPALAVSVSEDALVLENDGDWPVDLSNWTVRTGQYQAVLPRMTIVAPRSRIAIPGFRIGIPLLPQTILVTPDGHSLRQREVLGEEVAAVPVPEVSFDGVTEVLQPEPLIAVPEPVIAALPETANRSANLLFYAAAAAVLALCILLATLTAKREYRRR